MKPLVKAAFWASLARLISIALAAGAGNIIHQTVGGGLQAWPVAAFMAVISFLLMWFSEIQREENRNAQSNRKI